MRQRFPDLGHLPLLKFAGVALIASLSGACTSDVMRLSENAFSNPFASSKADPVSTGSVSNAPVSRVQSSSLAAPRSTPSYQAIPGSVSSNSQAVTGSVKGWSASGGTPVTLGQGDTVEALSGRYGVPVAALRSVNGLSGNSQPASGQQFIIPAFNPGNTGTSLGSAKSAATAAVAPTVAQAAPRSEQGQLSPRYEELKSAPSRAKEQVRSVGASKPAAADDDEDEAPAKAVPKVAPAPVPGFKPVDRKVSAANDKVDRANSAADKARDLKSRTIAAAPAKPAKAPAKVADDDDEEETVKVATPPKGTLPKGTPAKEAAAAPAPAKVAEVKKVEPVKTAKAKEDPVTTGSVADQKGDQEFRWPARGRVISGYGSKSASGANDGINIALPEGTPIKATEGGTVAYAGEEIKGYGKMVLIRHPNGYVSAYAHNGDLNVKRGDPIKRGQVIAKSGQSGNVTSPQLHFELRKGSEPVDPTKFLEGN